MKVYGGLPLSPTLTKLSLFLSLSINNLAILCDSAVFHNRNDELYA